MNVFVLDADITKCAEAHVDKHVVKMCTEALQIVSTALFTRNKHMYDYWNCVLYKPAYKHHPIVKWATESYANMYYVVTYGLAVADEYRFRFNKQHATEAKLTILRNILPTTTANFADMPKAMPDCYKSQSVISSYRRYYTYAKAHLHHWTNRSPPPFIVASRRVPATVGA